MSRTLQTTAEAPLALLATSFPELLQHIASFLLPSDVAFGLRLLCKRTAELLSAPTVRLSQPCPALDFHARWGCGSAFTQLKLSQRQKLLSLVAASGDMQNLDCILAQFADNSWGEEVLTAAARAGHRHVLEYFVEEGVVINYNVLDAAAGGGHLELCQHLLSTYDTCQPWGSTLAAAAGGGHRHVVQWLLQEAKCPGLLHAIFRAPANGHTELLAWLLQQPQLHEEDLKESWSYAVEGAAAGCDLATFRQLLEEPWPPGPRNGTAAAAVRYTPEQSSWQRMVQAAAGSCTPDWQAKVALLLQHPQSALWLSYQGTETPWSLHAAARQPDAVPRLQWLHGLGLTIHAALPYLTPESTISTGVLLLLLGVLQAEPLDGNQTAEAANRLAACACRTGRVELMQAIHSAGLPFRDDAIMQAAKSGHLHAVQWIREHLPAEQRRLSATVFRMAAYSGNLDLLWWLSLQEDAVTCPQAYSAAAAAGSVEVIRWLYALDLPFPATGAPYLAAARHGSVLAMRALASLGCPWGRRGRVFARAIHNNKQRASLWVLWQLINCGCPVVWRSALGPSRLRGDPEVEAWLRGWREQQKGAAAEAMGGQRRGSEGGVGAGAQSA